MSDDPRFDYYDAESARWLDPITPETKPAPAPHDAAIQAQRAVKPMAPARLAEIRRMRGGTMLRECVAEIDRLRTGGNDSTSLELQLSINRALMDRLDALEKQVKELQHCQSAS